MCVCVLGGGGGGGARAQKLVHIQKIIFYDFKLSKSPYFVNHLSESNSTCTIDTM